MRHLFVTNDFPPKTGGIESYLVSLCSGFRPADVVVIAPARPGHQEVDESLLYRVVRVRGNYLRARRPLAKRIAEVASQQGIDAIHFLQTLPLGRLARRVKKSTGAFVSIFVHGSEVLVPGKAPLGASLVRRTLRSADVVFCVSRFTEGAVLRVAGEQTPTALLEPSVDVDRFSLDVSGSRVREEFRLGSRFVVLFVSRLVKRKGADILIRAMESMPRAVALVVGSGPEEKSLRELVKELDLGPRVLFAGRVPDDRLPEFYAAADVFCMPCNERYGGLDTEGFGIIYLEAAASGLACVAGRCGGTVEAVEDGVTGFVLEESTPDAVADALRTLESDEALRARLGAEGRQRAEDVFSPQAMARRFEETVRGLRGRVT
ncbi:MAG TPA: glycosyltransferase family 4 protein [Actinomycetota bacterium]|nr:glycosyltransferase family 4 protein [Actinomycetota bacterium]